MMTNMSVEGVVSQSDRTTYEQLSSAISALSPGEGIKHLKKFLVTFPSFAAAHNDLGVLYLMSGNPTLALAHHEKASRLQPENTVFRKNLADFYAVELGWLDDAADIYLEVLRRNPRDTEAMIALGKLGEAMNGIVTNTSSQPAAALLSPTVSIPDMSRFEDTRSEEDLYKDALAYMANNDTDAAINSLEVLLANYPDNALACNDLGILLQQKSMFAEAVKQLEKAVNLEPESLLFRKNLADTFYIGTGNFEAAMKQYLQLLSKNPKDIDVLRAISHICIDLGKLEDAVVFMDRVLDVEPWNQEIREASRKIKAILSSPASAEVMPAKSVEELYSEAKENIAADQIEAAAELLQTIVRISPDNAVANNDLGVLLTRLGKYEDAQVFYETAVKIEPNSSNFRKNLADLYFTCLGKVDDAIFMYLELLKSSPRDVETLTNLGHISYAVGRPEEAKTFYRRALEIEPWNLGARESLREIR